MRADGNLSSSQTVRCLASTGGSERSDSTPSTEAILTTVSANVQIISRLGIQIIQHEADGVSSDVRINRIRIEGSHCIQSYLPSVLTFLSRPLGYSRRSGYSRLGNLQVSRPSAENLADTEVVNSCRRIGATGVIVLPCKYYIVRTCSNGKLGTLKVLPA